MKTHPPRELKVWRPQAMQDIELVYGTYASYSTPRHFHEDLEISINQKRAWTYSSRGSSYFVPACIALVTTPGEVHIASTSGENIFLALRIAPAFIQSMSSEMNRYGDATPHFVNPLIVDEALSTALIQLHATLRKQEASQLEQEELLLDTLGQLIMRLYQEQYTRRSFKKEHAAMKQVQEYLHAHYAEPVSLAQLSLVAHLSLFHLSHIFRAEIGIPPHVYQTQLRIARAKVLLAQQQSIAQVALATGFTSQSHFSMHFRRLVGVTPIQYVRDSKNVIDRGM